MNSNLFTSLYIFFKNLILYFFLFVENLLGAEEKKKRISWNEDNNKIHYTYSADEYDRKYSYIKSIPQITPWTFQFKRFI